MLNRGTVQKTMIAPAQRASSMGRFASSPAQPTRRLPEFLIGTLLFGLGVLSHVVFHFVGDLFVAEMIIIVTSPLLLFFYARRLARPELLRLFALLGLWLFAQIISDAYNQTPLVDRMRGTALISFFGIEIAFFAMIVGRNETRKAIFLTAYSLASIVLTRFQPNVAGVTGDFADNWKWAYSVGVTMLSLLLSSFLLKHGWHILAVLLLVAIAATDLLLNFRSAFLMLLVSTVLFFPVIPENIGRIRILPQKGSIFRLAVIAILAIAGGWSANQLVRYVSDAGLVAQKAQEKNQAQAQAGNLIVGGRPEFFVGLKAAMDSPIIGHGSWAKNMKYLEMQHDMLEEYGMQHDLTDAEADSQGLIPSHSHIVGAWVFAGFMGVVFWAYVFWQAIKGIVAAATVRPTLAPFYIWLLVGFSWNIFFSPFGSSSRIIESFTVLVIVDLVGQSRGRVPKAAPWRRQGAAAFRRTQASHAR